MSQKKFGVTLAVLLLVQLACSNILPSAEKIDSLATSVAATFQLDSLATQAASVELDTLATSVAATVQAGFAQVVPPPPVAPTVTATTQAVAVPQASETPTATATSGIISVSVSVDTNCRTGPGTPYPSVGALLVGETAEVVGKFPSAGFWIIKNPDGYDNCWLWGQYATVVGDTTNLKVYKQPPTPTPEFFPTPTETP